jgi:hypothetical protein
VGSLVSGDCCAALACCGDCGRKFCCFPMCLFLFSWCFLGVFLVFSNQIKSVDHGVSCKLCTFKISCEIV